MYIPPLNGPPSADDVTRVLRETRAGDLVTVGDEGLSVSMIPFLYDASVGPHGALLGHLARPNDQWRGADGREALALLHGPDGYVSPAWYAAKREHGGWRHRRAAHRSCRRSRSIHASTREGSSQRSRATPMATPARKAATSSTPLTGPPHGS